MDQIKYWIETEGTGHLFFYAFPCILVILFIILRGRRLKFLVPCMLISAVIVNPVFFEKWDELGLYAYWRILWVVPVIPAVAALVPAVTERISVGVMAYSSQANHKNWIVKTVVVTAGVSLVVLSGTFLYSETGGSFVESQNTAKVPGYVAQIVDRLLEIDSNPRVVFQNPIGTYARQYSGQIDQLYGRDIYGYLLPASYEAKDVHSYLSNLDGDLDLVATLMANDSYEYLVVDGFGYEEQFKLAGFELLDTVAGYGIYEVHGTPTVVKERNELGQVVKTTTIDECGQPVNSEAGYSTVEWQYDGNGNIIREFRINVDGVGVADSNGCSGYERVYDEYAHILIERNIDSDGKTVANSAGYAEYRREYSGSNLISESYYDADSKLVNRVDTGYATIRMSYDSSHNRTSEAYFDTNGEPVMTNAGYASLKREYNEKRIVIESYYGTDGEPVIIPYGYSSKKRIYDSAGNMTSEMYFDVYGLPVNNINGYANTEYEFDIENNVVLQRFLDASGRLVITGSGYAEVHRVYDGKHLIYEEYYGADGETYTQPAGYTAIAQEWFEDTLFSRSYLNNDGQIINRIDGYAKAVWEQGETCTDVHFYDTNGLEVGIESQNLTRDITVNDDGWSDWIIPNYNSVNSTQNIGYANLGPKSEGDFFTSTIEIEFKDVTSTEGQSFHFWTQGAQDGKWNAGNVWNGDLINLSDAPEDGIYRFTSTVAISRTMVDISIFNIGFRCDYWASGKYRVRFIKVEKGDTSTEWSLGL